MGCATHMAPTPSCPFRSCPEHVSCPTLKKRPWQKSLRSGAELKRCSRRAGPCQETLMAQDCVELWAMVGHPPCPPLHPYQHGQERNSTPLSCIMRTGRQNTREVEVCAAFHKLCVVGKEYTGRGAYQCQRTDSSVESVLFFRLDASLEDHTQITSNN